MALVSVWPKVFVPVGAEVLVTDGALRFPGAISGDPRPDRFPAMSITYWM